ncbi:DNA-protecting protein DprA [Candidatus Berkelbacteria bacterium]|nr:DNA-protecting protein DprA [Candidatus Berkelbacteria bacterium]
MANQLEQYVMLSLILPKLGPLTLAQLWNEYGDPGRILRHPGVNALNVSGFVQKVLKNCQAHGIDLISIKDERYPMLLKQITDPPLLIYTKGTLPADEPTVAIVGTRKPTDYGAAAAQYFAKGLASQGIIVVSGLAYGIDSVAHQATLDVGGKTVAVLPGGLDKTFPTQHEQLAKQIVTSGGALVSEYPPGTPAYKANFGVRNRIIAGFSLGTLVVEGAEHSGTMLTARSTLEYNRELFAVPHPIFSVMGVGPNKLIALGAKLVIEPGDILSELNLPLGSAQAGQTTAGLSSEGAMLMALLTKEPRHVDELVISSKLPVARVQSELVLLELRGLVRNLGGSSYVGNKPTGASRNKPKR